MSRALSSAFVAAMNAQETAEVIIALLTFTHDMLSTPLRISSDPTVRISDDPLLYATTSRGNDFIFLPISFSLPDDKGDVPPSVTITLDNVSRSMVTILRSIPTPASVLMEIVLGSSPNTVEISLPAMQLSTVTIDETSISAQLEVDHLVTEPHPAGIFTPGSFAGLFRK